MRPSLAAALLLALTSTSADAGPIAFGDVVVLTGTGVVRLDAANGYAASAPMPITVSDPRALDVAPDGRVYVLDLKPNRIVELSPGGTQRPFTPTGTRPWGQNGEDVEVSLVQPHDMALGRDGALWVFDQAFVVALGGGLLVPVDPASGLILEGGDLGVHLPLYVDIGPIDGAAAAYGDLGCVISTDPIQILQCYVGPGDAAVLRDGRVILRRLTDVLVLASDGELLEVFAAVPAGRTAGGIGGEFFFMDTPTSIARFDLETGDWAPIYDAGEPIFDLAVQQIPEPGALWLLAAALASTVAVRRRRASDENARPLLLAPGRVAQWAIRAALGAALVLLAPALALAGPIAFGDVVVLTGTSVVRLDAASGYAADAPTPVAMNDPQAIDVAPDGRLYVLDRGQVACCSGWPFVPLEFAPVVTIPNRVIELAPDGTQRAFSPTGERRTTIYGEAFDSLLIGPRDMALGRDGLLWIADQDYNRQTSLGFDGTFGAVDPVTERIVSAPNGFGGTSPRSIDIGPYAGATWRPDGSGVPGFSIEGEGLRICDEDGCDGFFFQGSGVVLRDGRYVALVWDAHDLDREEEFFGARGSQAVADLIVFDGTGLVLEILKDTDAPLRQSMAGGVGEEFFFTDTPDLGRALRPRHRGVGPDLRRGRDDLRPLRAADPRARVALPPRERAGCHRRGASSRLPLTPCRPPPSFRRPSAGRRPEARLRAGLRRRGAGCRSTWGSGCSCYSGLAPSDSSCSAPRYSDPSSVSPRSRSHSSAVRSSSSRRTTA